MWVEQRPSYRLANDHLLSLFSFAYLIRRPVTLLPAQGVVKRSSSSDGVIVALPVGAADHATCKSPICMLPRCGSDRSSGNGLARAGLVEQAHEHVGAVHDIVEAALTNSPLRQRCKMFNELPADYANAASDHRFVLLLRVLLCPHILGRRNCSRIGAHATVR